jgi:hypothetical protein
VRVLNDSHMAHRLDLISRTRLLLVHGERRIDIGGDTHAISFKANALVPSHPQIVPGPGAVKLAKGLSAPEVDRAKLRICRDNR